MNKYTKEFYSAIEDGSLKSARKVIPIIMDLLHPKSVVDVGCGTGTWLSIFLEKGIKNIVGIDGPFIDKKNLLFPSENFLVKDLDKGFELENRFDLAISIEVAEHIAPQSADKFIDSLVKLAPVIVFSAAIPYQGGYHHINEQWPSYWSKIFMKNNYFPVDFLREKMWANDGIKWNYRQNIIIFVEKSFLENNLKMSSSNPEFLDFVHPSTYLSLLDKKCVMPKKIARSLMLAPYAIFNFVKSKIN